MNVSGYVDTQSRLGIRIRRARERWLCNRSVTQNLQNYRVNGLRHWELGSRKVPWEILQWLRFDRLYCSDSSIANDNRTVLFCWNQMKVNT